MSHTTQDQPSELNVNVNVNVNNVNPLLAVPSPRDLDIVKEHIDRLPVDTLWVKYYKQEEAYDILRMYFLTHSQYTHLIICPDDLIVKESDFERLLYTVIKYKYDFPVVSATCHINNKEEDKQFLGMTPKDKLPNFDHNTRRYEWMTVDSPEVVKGEPFEVSFNGLALCCIRRDVVEKIPFQNIHGCCNDLRFAHDCRSYGIKLMVDPKIRLIHLKKSDHEYDRFLVGKVQPYTYLSPFTSLLT